MISTVDKFDGYEWKSLTEVFLIPRMFVKLLQRLEGDY